MSSYRPGNQQELRRAFASAREACRREGGAAHLASFFLPRAKRDGAVAVWALARVIERVIVAEMSQAMTAAAGVAGAAATGGGECCGGGCSAAALLKSRVDEIYAGSLQLPRGEFRDEAQWVLAAAAETVRRFEIPRELWFGLIDALAERCAVARVATFRSLDERLAATGGNIARIVAAVLGARHSDAGVYASSIGRGAALTGILRRLRGDVIGNRILLPLEDMTRFRYSEREMLGLVLNDRFRALVRHEAARARALIRDGAGGTCWLADDGSRMAAGVFIAGQLSALDEIETEPEGLVRGDHAPRRQPSLLSQLPLLPRAWKIATGACGAPAVVATDRSPDLE